MNDRTHEALNDEMTRDEDAERQGGARAPSLTTADLATAGSPEPRASAAKPEDSDGDDERTPLLPDDEMEGSRERWHSIQASFVDEPRRAVKEADELVAEVMSHLAESFSTERGKLEQQWDRGDDVSTEDLRIALRRYRSFFERLLAA